MYKRQVLVDLRRHAHAGLARFSRSTLLHVCRSVYADTLQAVASLRHAVGSRKEESMEIKWSNVVLFALIVLSFAWAVRAQDSIFLLLSRMGMLGPAHPSDERLWGLMVFGLVLVTLVAVLKIFIENLRNR
jgi:hypothetical protein